VCKNCEEGKFQELAEADEYTCKECTNGTHALNATHASVSSPDICTFCPIATFQNVNVANTLYKCQNCATGTYSSEEGQTVCKLCDEYPTEFINSQCCGGTCPQLDGQCGVSCS
jgi:hypothetical protein